MTCDEHQFPEEETPEGTRLLLPCLNCGLAAGDGLIGLKAELADSAAALHALEARIAALDLPAYPGDSQYGKLVADVQKLLLKP